MSYEADLGRLAQRVASMISDPPAPRAVDIPVVDAARLAVRRWCRQVLADVAATELPAAPGLTELATNPVGALRAVLEVDPVRFGDVDPRDVEIDHPAASEGGQRWREIRVDAVVLAHGWSSADPKSRPAGEARWSTIADVAAVAEAAALLDRDVARLHLSAALRSPHTSRAIDLWDIAAAAEHVRGVAGRGPLQQPAPLRPSRLLPLRVQTVQAVAPALERLTDLLDGAHHVRPETILALAGAHRRTLLTLAEVVDTERSTGSAGDLADGLREQAAYVWRLQPATREIASLNRDDPRPLVQAKQIRHIVGESSRADRALAEAVIPALEVTRALSAAIDRELDGGSWYQRDPSGSNAWVPTNRAARRRRERDEAKLQISATSTRAGEHAERLLGQLGPPGHGERGPAAPRAVLTADLLYRDRPRASAGDIADARAIREAMYPDTPEAAVNDRTTDTTAGTAVKAPRRRDEPIIER